MIGFPPLNVAMAAVCDDIGACTFYSQASTPPNGHAGEPGPAIKQETAPRRDEWLPLTKGNPVVVTLRMKFVGFFYLLEFGRP